MLLHPAPCEKSFLCRFTSLVKCYIHFFLMKNTINKISLIIPVYNEEENLRDLYSEITRSLSGLTCPWELVLVDDGSTDSSLAVIRDLAGADERVRFLSFAKNCGQSAAFAAGL